MIVNLNIGWKSIPATMWAVKAISRSQNIPYYVHLQPSKLDV